MSSGNGLLTYNFIFTLLNKSGRKADLVVYNVLNGKALKIPGVYHYKYLVPLASAIARHGQCSDEEDVCVLITSARGIAGALKTPAYNESAVAYQALIKFLGLEPKKAFKEQVKGAIKGLVSSPRRPRYLR